MPGRVIQCVEQIATQEQRGGQLVFTNFLSEKIKDRPSGLPLAAAITRVDNKVYYSDETYAREDPADRLGNVCEYRDGRADNA